MTTWLVSTQRGADTNGGTSQSILAQGTNGVTVIPANTIVDATANAFTVGMVGQGINIVVSGVNKLRTITGYTSASTVTYSGADLGANTGLTWYVGGMWKTVTNALVNTNSLAAGDNVFLGAGVYRSTTAVAYSGSSTATGSNGVTSNGGTTFTDSTAAAFTSGMVGQNIEIVAGGSTYLCKITAYSSSTVVTIAPLTAAGFPTAAYSSCTWIVGKIAVVGDVDGAQTGDAGQVTLTAYTTNDKTAPSGSVLLALGAHTYLSFSLLTLVEGSNGVVTCTAGAHDISFVDCTVSALYSAANIAMLFVSSSTGLALSVTLDRCILVGPNPLRFSLATTNSGAADWDALVVIRNSLFISTTTVVSVIATSTNTFKGGGVRLYDCTIFGSTGVSCATASQLSTSVPCEIHNSSVLASTGLSAATAGQLTESYNLLASSTPRTNVSAGTGSISDQSYAPLVELGQSVKWGGVIRQFMAPDGASSSLLGFSAAGFSGNYPVVDWANRPRPSGGGSANAAVGYMEFHDFAIEDTVVYNDSPASGKLVGPGDQFIQVPVDATSSTISIYLYQGSGYTGTNYATATLLADGELGVTAQTETCSSTLSSWQKLTFTGQTPTKAGWVTVQVASYDTSGTGTLNFDTLGVA